MSANARTKVYRDSTGQWRWTHWRSSDKVATNGESLTNKAHAIEQAKALFPDATLEVEGDDGEVTS